MSEREPKDFFLFCERKRDGSVAAYNPDSTKHSTVHIVNKPECDLLLMNLTCTQLKTIQRQYI